MPKYDPCGRKGIIRLNKSGKMKRKYKASPWVKGCRERDHKPRPQK